MNKTPNDNTNNEIDFILILSSIYKKRKLILNTSFLILLLSIIYAISLPNEYKSFSTFYPHYENIQDNNAGLQGLAGLAGINLNNQNNISIPPSLYPELIRSNKFKNEVLKTKISYNNDDILYKDYIIKKNENKINFKSFILYPISLFKKKIINSNNNLKNKNLEYITETDDALFSYLDEKINISINEKDGFIELSIIDENPEVSAIVASSANYILQKNIIDFKIKNINDVYNFTIDQLEIAKNNLYKIQDSLANFRDSNISIKSDIFKNKLIRLETEVNVSKNIYNELAIAKEKTAIDVRKNTPIFTIINPVFVPFKKHLPNRFMMVISFTLIGIILLITGIILYKPLLILLNEIIS